MLCITGAAGQLGSRAQRLAAAFGDVLGLDRHGAPGADLVAWDLCTPASDEVRARLAHVECVLHIAGSRNDVAPDATHVEQAYAMNAIATANLLDALGPAVRRLVLVSSMSVYAPAVEIADESTAVAPASIYGASKAAAERIARMWARDRGIPLAIVRLAQVYGPGTDPRNGLYRMIATALEGHAIQLDCRKELRRDYIHADDAARLLVELARRDDVGDINVGSGDGVTMFELAELIAGATGAPRPEWHGSTAGADRVLDTRRARTLGLVPAISLAAGIHAEVVRRKGGAA
jgi:nucleoside-diphosphate-sugar epimerase